MHAFFALFIVSGWKTASGMRGAPAFFSTFFPHCVFPGGARNTALLGEDDSFIGMSDDDSPQSGFPPPYPFTTFTPHFSPLTTDVYRREEDSICYIVIHAGFPRRGLPRSCRSPFFFLFPARPSHSWSAERCLICLLCDRTGLDKSKWTCLGGSKAPGAPGPFWRAVPSMCYRSSR